MSKQKTQEKNKMSEIDDQILRHFEIKKRLGKGAYGIVWKAIDRKTNQTIAVKKIFDAFRNETDAQRTFREIMFLRAFRNHPNVIQLHCVYKAINNLDIYLSFEYMESDLHNVIKRGSILKDVHKRYVMYQLFNAIKYIHSGNVIHRDLKPSNVLIDSKCRCKIADFGLARSVSQRYCGDRSSGNMDPAEPILTDYVATRWYRAPEILVASKRYTKGIDMWSLGCILGEMIRGKPLFPGSSTVNQIERIVSALPEASDKDITSVGAGFGSALLNQHLNSSGNPKLDDLLIGSPEDAKGLVKSLLLLDPTGRLTAKQALTHKYVEKFRHTIPESELNSDVLPPFRDDVQLTVPEYRSKLYEIMQSTEKGSGSVKQSSRKIRDTSAPRLDSTITVTSSLNSAKNKISSRKVQDNERRSLNTTEVKKSDRKSYPLPQNSSIGSKSQSTSLINYPITQNSESKFKPIPKIKYCKISSITETKSPVATDRIELQQKILYNNLTRPSVSVEKRHSIDGSYNSSDVLHSYQNLPERNPLHSSYKSLNSSKYIRNETKQQTTSSYTTWANKYLGASSDDVYKQINSEPLTEKVGAPPPVKITKSETGNNDNSSYYEKRLKSLEERIQKHKMDINALFAQSAKHKMMKSDSIDGHKSQSMANNGKQVKTKVNLNRSKSENANILNKPRTSLKYDYTYAEGERLNVRRLITAKECYDVRKSQVIS